jgi:hypothetical protein
LTLSFLSPPFIPLPVSAVGGFFGLIKRLAAAGFRLAIGALGGSVEAGLFKTNLFDNCRF